MQNSLYYSYLHALIDNSMLHAAECAHDIERATEAPITLIVQIVALSSGVIGDDDYLFDFTPISGPPLKIIHQSK